MYQLSFCEGVILKGNILYNHVTGIRIYLGALGIDLLNKIRKNEGKVDKLNKYEKLFIDELKALGFLVENDKYRDIEKVLEDKPPHVIIWEVTRKCNFNCEYCYVRHFSSERSERIDEEKIRKTVLNRILESNVLEVIITGGEPLLLGCELKEIIRRLRENKIGVVVFTNGSLINEDWLNFFKKYNVRLHISLDTLVPSKDRRNKSQLYKIVENIVRASKILKNKLVIQTTFYPDNIKLANSIRFFAKLCKAQLRYGTITPVYRDGFSLFYETLPLYKEFLEKSNITPKKDHEGCGAGKFSVFIRADGELTPCTMFYDIVGGNVVSRSITEIIENPENELYKEIQKICSSRFPTSELKFCEKCPIRFMCNGGCRARAFLLSRDIKGVDPQRCYVEKDILIRKVLEEGLAITIVSLFSDYKGRISDEFFEKALLRLIDDWEYLVKNNYVWFVTYENKVEGIVIFNRINDVGKILWIVVSPEARGKGIGSFLLKKAEECLKELGCKKMQFGTSKISLEFYLKNGYRIVKEEYNFGERIFIVEKQLK